MLLGEYEQRLDEKNRLTIPARLRDQFAGGVFLSRGIERCLVAFTREGWDAYTEEQVARLDPMSREGRMLMRHLFAGAALLEADKQGRIALPTTFARYAELQRDVVVVGIRDRLEIWDRDAWARLATEFEGGAEHAAERVARESR